MGQDIFLELKGIEGDADDAGHAGHIEVSSFSFNVSSKVDARSTTGEQGHQGTDVSSISFSKKVDKSTAKLLDYACKRKPIEGGCFVRFCRPGGQLVASNGLKDYLTFELKDVFIESYSLNGGGGYPTESFTLQFGVIEWTLKNEKGVQVGGDQYDRTKGAS